RRGPWTWEVNRGERDGGGAPTRPAGRPVLGGVHGRGAGRARGGRPPAGADREDPTGGPPGRGGGDPLGGTGPSPPVRRGGRRRGQRPDGRHGRDAGGGGLAGLPPLMIATATGGLHTPG